MKGWIVFRRRFFIKMFGMREKSTYLRSVVLKRILNTIKIYCGVEQLVARRAHNPEVIGSSPVPATFPIDKNL